MRPASSSVEPEFVPNIPINTNPKVVSPLANADSGIGQADSLAHLRPDIDWSSEEAERDNALARGPEVPPDLTTRWIRESNPNEREGLVAEVRLYVSGASTYLLDNVNVIEVGQARNGRWATFSTSASTYLWFGQVGGGVFDPAGAFILPPGVLLRVPVHGRAYARGLAGAATVSLIEEARSTEELTHSGLRRALNDPRR